MNFVFRVLSSEVKNSVSTTKSGKQYYEIPIIIRKDERDRRAKLIIPSEKTYKKGDSLYIVLDSNSIKKDILLTMGKTLSLTDNQVLNLINKDYLNYIMDKNYNHKLSHAVNHLMPIGTQKISQEGEIEIDRWSKKVTSLLQKYGKDYIAINPVINNSLYPFHYVNFLEHKFVREYRSNLMMFTLFYDEDHYQYHNKKIYYIGDEELTLMYEAITDQQFYKICDEKDKINKATTPFLKSFNDHGLAKEIIEFMKEDEIYSSRIKSIYAEIRNEMKLDKEKEKKYFIPALNSMLAIKNRYDEKNGKILSESEKKLLETSIQDRMNQLVKLYEKNNIFYFTSNDLIIEDGCLTINSALKRIIQMDIEDLEYDFKTKTLYNIQDYNNKDVYVPILEVVTKKEIKELEEIIYRRWIETKKGTSK